MKRLCAAAAAAMLLLGGCELQQDEEADGNAAAGEASRENAPAYQVTRRTSPPPVEDLEAQRFARLALSCLHRQYPNKISHVLNSGADAKAPNELYPAFYGCFDWHSAVHGHWLLVRLWGLNRVAPLDREIEDALAMSFTESNIAQEVAYIRTEGRESFERPYGMAWLMQLTMELAEIAQGDDAKAKRAKAWLETLEPLETAIAGRVETWLPNLVYPIRIGTHNQTAFAFGLMLDWARVRGKEDLAAALAEKAREFHGEDERCPIGYEPSGEDFLSPCLMEADLMRRVMDRDEFKVWLTGFLPGIPTDGSADWLEPGEVRDPTDGKLVHLYGLNLSRAWALRGIASALPEDDARIEALQATADAHAEAGLESVTSEHYAGSHWLASFATYLQSERWKAPMPVSESDAKDEADAAEGESADETAAAASDKAAEKAKDKAPARTPAAKEGDAAKPKAKEKAPAKAGDTA